MKYTTSAFSIELCALFPQGSRQITDCFEHRDHFEITLLTIYQQLIWIQNPVFIVTEIMQQYTEKSWDSGRKPMAIHPLSLLRHLSFFFFFFKSYLACLELSPMNEFTVEKPKGLFDLSAILQNHVTPDTRTSSALYSLLVAQHC